MNLIKKIMKKSFKRLKEILVKKVFLNKVIFKSEDLIYELKLKNFGLFKKKVEFQYIVDDIVHIVPYKLSGNHLYAKIPFELLNQTKQRAVIKLYINKQLMWIKESNEFSEKNVGYLVKEHYFITSVNKNIFIRNSYSDFPFRIEQVICNKV